MNTVRLNITITEKIGKKLNHVPNKSVFITAAVEEMPDRKELQTRLYRLREAYRTASPEETRLAQDWDATSGDNL